MISHYAWSFYVGQMSVNDEILIKSMKTNESKKHLHEFRNGFKVWWVRSPNSTSCVTSRYDTHDVPCVSRASWRACCAFVRVAPCLFQYGGPRRSSSIRVYTCSRFASTQEQLMKNMGGPPQSTLWRRSWTHVAPCCPTSATQHVTTISCAKMHVLDTVRVVTRRNKWNLG